MMYVLYKNNEDYVLTTRENYEARIRDVHKLTLFRRSNGFNTLSDVQNYIKKYLKIDLSDVEVIE